MEASVKTHITNIYNFNKNDNNVVIITKNKLQIKKTLLI